MSMEEVKVISAEIDGRELRKEKAGSRRYLRCDGKDDECEINEAIRSLRGGRRWSVPASAWERIFGRK